MTTMTVHDVQQGSPEWHALRAQHFCASEAAAMMGVSPYMTRSELLRQKATGIIPEVDAATQRRFDDGHATEAAFLASREWPNQAARNSARAVLIEFERFCAQQEKAAA